jgi:hypothetical protein
MRGTIMSFRKYAEVLGWRLKASLKLNLTMTSIGNNQNTTHHIEKSSQKLSYSVHAMPSQNEGVLL